MEAVMKQKRNLVAAFSFITLAVLVAIKATPYMLIASFAYGCMVLGILNRRNGKLHAKLMATAIGLDLILVLFLEATRGAIAEAVAMDMTILQQLHILFSTLAVVLYFPLIYIGLKNLKHQSSPDQKIWHRRLGFTAFALRSLGFLLMFSLLSHVRK